MNIKFKITDAPYKPGNPVLGYVNIVNGVPCPDGLDETAAEAVWGYLTSINYVWLPRNKTMPEFDDQNEEHIRAAMNGLDCEGYHAEEVSESKISSNEQGLEKPKIHPLTNSLNWQQKAVIEQQVRDGLAYAEEESAEAQAYRIKVLSEMRKE
jgi:hypothetical protein